MVPCPYISQPSALFSIYLNINTTKMKMSLKRRMQIKSQFENKIKMKIEGNSSVP